MSQNNQEKMYNLGVAMDEFRKFFWIGICLFFLIIPPIILLWKYIKFLIALKEVKETSSPQNENLNYGLLGLLISIGISFGVMLATATLRANFPAVISYIFSALQIICIIFGWIKLEQWGEDLYRERSTGNMAQFKEGLKDIKIAQILSFIIIGVFLIPGAYGKAGGALIREFGQGGPSLQQPQYSQPQQPQYGQTQQPQYGQTQQPQYTQPQQPPAPSPIGSIICPQCGVQLKDKNIKFCGTCGYKF